MSRQTAPGRAAEDYLEALLLLEQGQSEAHGAQLARRMGISRASVSIAMKQLRQNGYITVDKGHRLCLTDAGRAVAVRIYERHCFFTEMLLRAGVSFATAQRDACRMEHAISEESFARLRTAMDNKKKKVCSSFATIDRSACFVRTDQFLREKSQFSIDRQLCMNYILKTIKRVICRFQRAYGSLQLSLDCPPILLNRLG